MHAISIPIQLDSLIREYNFRFLVSRRASLTRLAISRVRIRPLSLSLSVHLGVHVNFHVKNRQVSVYQVKDQVWHSV